MVKLRHHQRRVRARALLRRYRATRNLARALEGRGAYTEAEAVWERHRVIWCELVELGLDPDETREVA